MVPQTHESTPDGILIDSAIFSGLTLVPKLPTHYHSKQLMDSSDLDLEDVFLGPQKSATQMASRSVQPFCAYASPKIPYLFQWGGQPQKLEKLETGPHLILGPSAHPSQPFKWHHDRFSHFCSTHKSDQQTHRQTHTHRPTTLLCL